MQWMQIDPVEIEKRISYRMVVSSESFVRAREVEESSWKSHPFWSMFMFEVALARSNLIILRFSLQYYSYVLAKS
jgi:anti-sigma-K factor RskA